MIVVIEGMDASGKQTQSKRLAEALKATRFSFPNYSSTTGRAIEAHLKKQWVAQGTPGFGVHELLDPMVFQCLQTVNRLELLPEIIAANQRGHIVFDRYFQSAMVYGALDGLDRDWLQIVQRAPMPPADLNILIDIPVEVGFKRRPERRDRYEANRDYLEKVRTEYLRLFSEQIDRDLSLSWHIVDGFASEDEVFADLWRIVSPRLGVAR